MKAKNGSFRAARSNLLQMAGSMKSLATSPVAIGVLCLISAYGQNSSPGQALDQKEYLRAVLPPDLVRYAGIEVPAQENIRILSDASGRYLEFRLVPGQAKKNNGNSRRMGGDHGYVCTSAADFAPQGPRRGCPRAPARRSLHPRSLHARATGTRNGRPKLTRAGLDLLIAHEIERDVSEGNGHTGRGAVVQVLARRKT